MSDIRPNDSTSVEKDLERPKTKLKFLTLTKESLRVTAAAGWHRNTLRCHQTAYSGCLTECDTCWTWCGC